jgi:outer membrane protein assembly factor BamB
LAGDWRQFRGTDASGHVTDANIPTTWSESNGVKWKIAVPGEGWSSPVATDGKLWLTTATEEGKSLRALCVEAASGKMLWNVEVFKNDVVPPKHKRNSYASPTGLIESSRFYAHFGAMGTACLDAATGKKLWENRSLVVDHQNGPGGSLATFNDLLLVAYDGTDQQFGAALRKRDGSVAWKSPRSAAPKLEKLVGDLRKAYGTPAIFTIDGRPQAITTAAERLYSHDPLTGEELWCFDYKGFSNVPIPVFDGKNLYISTGFGKPVVVAVKATGAKGDVTATNMVWKQVKGGPDQCTPMLADGRLYMVTSGGIASCLRADTGDILWTERIGKDFAASPLLSGNRLYLFDADGTTTIYETGSDSPRVVSKNVLDSGCMATPAVLDGSLYIRTKTHLYRIDR